MTDSDPTLISRVELYKVALEERYKFYLEKVWFPVVDGKNQPVFQQTLDEENQFLLLREVAQRSKQVQEGTLDPDAEVEAFMQNVDGAQDRLIELGLKFGA